MEPTAILSLTTKLWGFAGNAKNAAARKALVPLAEDKKLLKELRTQLEERRVFRAAFRDEIEVACLASLDEVRRASYDVLGKLENEPSKAIVGALLNDVRSFLDTWRGPRGRRVGYDSGIGHGPDVALPEFFLELGALRLNVATYREMLEELEAETLFKRLFGKARAGGGLSG